MHIDEQDLIKFQSGTMTPDETAAFLSHIETCDFCLEQMLEFGSNDPVCAPAYLMSETLEKADSIEVSLARTTYKVSHRLQFLRYSLRTIASVTASLVLLFGISNIDISSLQPAYNVQASIIIHDRKPSVFSDFTKDISQTISQSTHHLTQSLNDLSSKLMNGGN